MCPPNPIYCTYSSLFLRPFMRNPFISLRKPSIWIWKRFVLFFLAMLQEENPPQEINPLSLQVSGFRAKESCSRKRSNSRCARPLTTLPTMGCWNDSSQAGMSSAHWNLAAHVCRSPHTIPHYSIRYRRHGELASRRVQYAVGLTITNITEIIQEMV